MQNVQNPAMKNTYTVTNPPADSGSSVRGKRTLVIGGMDDFMALAIENTREANTTQRVAEVRPASKAKTPLNQRVPSVQAGLSTPKSQHNAQPQQHQISRKQDSCAGHRIHGVDYTAFQKVAAETPLPHSKPPPKTEADIVNRRMEFGLTTSPEKLARLKASLPPSGKPSTPASASESSTDSGNASSSNAPSSISSSTDTTLIADTPDIKLSDPKSLTPLVTVHRTDLDALVYRARPLSIHHNWRANRKIANTHVGLLVAEVTELRDRERRYKARGHAIEDLAIDLVLGESATNGSKSVMQMAAEREMQRIRARDEEQRKKDYAPPMNGKEMERRNAPTMVVRDDGKKGRLKEIQEEDG